MPALPPQDPRESRKDLALAVALALAVFVLYILPSPWRPLDETAEARIAVTAREMLRTGDWVLPSLGGHTRVNKPPLPYWLVALSARILGPDAIGGLVSEEAAVLPSAVCGALCVFLVVAFGARVFGSTAGLWAGLTVGLAGLFVRFAQFGTGEIVLTFFTTCALLAEAWLVCAPRPRLSTVLALGLPLGLALLTKGHVPLLLVLGAAALEALRRKRFDARKTVLFLAALGVALAVAAPWFLAVRTRDPAASQVWREELAGYGHAQSQRWIFYLYQLPYGLLPWTPFLLSAWIVARLRRKEDPNLSASEALPGAIERFLAGAAVLGFLAFYATSKQQPYYLLPLFPLLALAGGAAIARLDRPGGLAEERLGWAQLALGCVIGLLAALAPLGLQAGLLPSQAPLIPWALSVPLGLLTIALSYVASRQWAEGKARGAGACIGITVLALQLGWSMLVTREARERHVLARESTRLRLELQGYPADWPIFVLDPKKPDAVRLFYLDRLTVLGLDELVEAGVGPDGQPRPPDPGTPTKSGVVLCTRETSAEVGLTPEIGNSGDSDDLQLIPLPDYRATGELFLPLMEKRKKRSESGDAAQRIP